MKKLFITFVVIPFFCSATKQLPLCFLEKATPDGNKTRYEFFKNENEKYIEVWHSYVGEDSLIKTVRMEKPVGTVLQIVWMIENSHQDTLLEIQRTQIAGPEWFPYLWTTDSTQKIKAQYDGVSTIRFNRRETTLVETTLQYQTICVVLALLLIVLTLIRIRNNQ